MAKAPSAVYELIEAIEMGDNVVEQIVLHKPNLGELTAVKATDEYTNGLQMLAACSDQSILLLKRLSFDDAKKLMGEVLPEFLGFTEEASV